MLFQNRTSRLTCSLLKKIPYCKAKVWLKYFIVYLPVMPQFSLTVVPTLVQGLRYVVENHEIPENDVNTYNQQTVEYLME